MDDLLWATAGAAGIGYINLAPSSLPRVASILLDSTKNHAKAIRRKIPGITHAQALEALARCSGFAHWHAMQTALQRMSQSSEVDVESSKCLAPCFRMLVQVPRDVPPEDAQLKLLEDFALDLATQLQVPVPAAREVLALVYRADSWAGLQTRDPTSSSSPFYSIQVWEGAFEPPGEGTFNESPACKKLVEQQDQWFLVDDMDDGEEGRPPHPGDAQNVRELQALLKQRPDFLYGYLVLGEMQKDRPRLAQETLAEGVRRGMKMLEESGVRSIQWASLGNRFFHRMLYALMQICVEHHPCDAVKLAEWMLCLNPGDNIGVRMEYAELRFAARAHHEISKSLVQGLGSWMPGLRGHFLMGLLLLGDECDDAQPFGLEHLMLAIFEVPALRDLVMKGSLPDPDEYPEKYPNGAPDEELEYLESQRDWFDENRPEILVLAKKLLKRKGVLSAEIAMKELRGEDPVKWSSACAETALAEALAYGVKRYERRRSRGQADAY